MSGQPNPARTRPGCARGSAARFFKNGYEQRVSRVTHARLVKLPLGHFEDKMKIGNRIKVTGRYDIKNKNVKKQG